MRCEEFTLGSIGHDKPPVTRYLRVPVTHPNILQFLHDAENPSSPESLCYGHVLMVQVPTIFFEAVAASEFVKGVEPPKTWLLLDAATRKPVGAVCPRQLFTEILRARASSGIGVEVVDVLPGLVLEST